MYDTKERVIRAKERADRLIRRKGLSAVCRRCV